MLTDWVLDAVLPPQAAGLALVRPEDALVRTAQRTDRYPARDRVVRSTG